MLRVLLFARLREEAGVGEIEVPWQESFASIEDVVKVLRTQSPQLQQALDRSRLLYARNQNMAKVNSAVEDGDEIAIFPPVTGG